MPELQSGDRPLGNGMNRDNGFFGLVVGGIVALAAMIFIFSGGELGGKKTVEGDQDLRWRPRIRTSGGA